MKNVQNRENFLNENKEIKKYVITKEQLDDLIFKVHLNITNLTDKAGEYSLGSKLENSVTDTIKNFFSKKCKEI